MDTDVDAGIDVDADLGAIANKISSITIEIDALTQQIEPVLARLRELKKEKSNLKTQLQPVMKTANVEHMTTQAVQISYKPDSKRKPPFNRQFVEVALQAFFESRPAQFTAQAALTFMDTFRNEHKLVTESVTFRKAKDYVAPTVQSVRPVHVRTATSQSGAALHGTAGVKPFEI